MTMEHSHRRAFRTQTICGNEVRSEDTLIWYDGPLLETLRDTEGNLYLSYNPGDTAVVARLPLDILLKALRSEIPLLDAFRAGTKKFAWSRDDGAYLEVDKFDDDDLFDPEVLLGDTGASAEDYVSFLVKQAQAEEPTKTPDVIRPEDFLHQSEPRLPIKNQYSI